MAASSLGKARDCLFLVRAKSFSSLRAFNPFAARSSGFWCMQYLDLTLCWESSAMFLWNPEDLTGSGLSTRLGVLHKSRPGFFASYPVSIYYFSLALGHDFEFKHTHLLFTSQSFRDW